MCIIIDTNALPSVFKTDSVLHKDFEPILSWILEGRGKVVYGGSKYKMELGKYLHFIQTLQTARKAVPVDDGIVDRRTEELSEQIVHRDFDDQHLIALLQISGCQLICSLDERAYPYFRHRQFFPVARLKPRIYRSIRNKDLLCDRFITEICRPCVRLNIEQRNSMQLP
jgi:hypothetical protein